jgi:hypothetical protein
LLKGGGILQNFSTKEVPMATRAGFYKSGKRNKELNRQKKQEAKRQRRLTKGEPSGEEEPEAILEAPVSGQEEPGSVLEAPASHPETAEKAE